MAVSPCEAQTVWTDKWRHNEAECTYQMIKHGVSPASNQSAPSTLVSEIAKARQHIQMSLKGADMSGCQVSDVLVSRLQAVELDNTDLRKVTKDLQAIVKKLESRIAALEAGGAAPKEVKTASKEAAVDDNDDDDDDDIDLFGSEEEDEEAEKIKEERMKAYQAKKSKKPALIAKSNVILDVKPWDDETDMKKVEECVRSVTMDGLLWGAAKLVPVGYGIKKLTISSVVVDDKVSMEDVEEAILAFEDYIQSVDIAAFNKV